MHCRSCELSIEGALRSIPGISKVTANVRQSAVTIHHRGVLNLDLVRHAVQEAGYDVGEEEKRLWLTRSVHEYRSLGISAMILLGFFTLARVSGFFDFSIAYSTHTDAVSALFMGITAGVSTCMALVGGLVLGISARHAEKHPEATSLQKFRPHMFFNLGRISAFFLFGGLLGSVGGFIVFSSAALGVMMVVIAGFMLLIGLQLIEIFPALSTYTFALPSSVARAIGIHKHHAKEYSHRTSVIMGALTFFLPCGFTQLMQMNAIASGGFLRGGFLMAAFAVGTAPGLLGVGGLTSVVKGFSAKLFFKTAGLLVILLALMNVTHGFRLIGFVLPSEQEKYSASLTQNPVTIENGMQVVRMRQVVDGYRPSSVVIRKGVPVRWILTSEAANSCAASISVPSLSITQYLVNGENVIEFTPERAGTIPFSCTMGMYPGLFTVID